MHRRMLVAAIIGVGLAFGGTSAWAGTNLVTYDTVVGGLGHYGYTSQQTKSTTGAAGLLLSSSVGGDYVVTARMESVTTNNYGTWTGFVVNDGTSHNLYNSHAKNNKVRVEFKNHLQTLVNVRVQGSWKSN